VRRAVTTFATFRGVGRIRFIVVSGWEASLESARPRTARRAGGRRAAPETVRAVQTPSRDDSWSVARPLAPEAAYSRFYAGL
jgi:hypothetical protein